MKIFRLLSYFSQLRKIISFKSTCFFALAYIRNKIKPPHHGNLARIPIGTYVFYFPSLTYFEGLFTEIFLKETYYLSPTQKPIQTIDCGANIGVSLLYIKTRAPQARVKCFEPNSVARSILEKNIEVNGWEDDVQVFPYALGREKGSAKFFVDTHTNTSSGGGISPHLKERGMELDSYFVEVETLSHYITGPIDFLKIDIEGPEIDVLEELIEKDVLKQVASMQIEYHYIPGFFTRTLSEILTLLESGGFHSFVQSTAPPHQIINRDVMHTYMIFAWK